MAKASASPPWPREVLDKYEPIRTLGKGAFATVVLARRKSTTKGNENRLVAMKQVKACTNTEVQYSHRELYILQELSHPNIMKLVESWEPSEGSVLMALSYAPGKTLEYLLRNIGAPSLAFCRVVIAQLVDAVAYLHSHAVIHRDIKPDNMVVKNVSLDDKEILHDSIGNIDTPWGALLEKWHVTLLDFGFARALGPQDLEEEKQFKTDMSKRLMVLDQSGDADLSNHKGKRTKDATSIDRSLNRSTSSTGSYASIDDLFKQGEKSSKASRVLKRKSKPAEDINMSRRPVKQLSAVGNRQYAAPEVKNKVREERSTEESRHKSVTSTLSPFVSDYGMVADAFSVGSSARYILTGVPPQESVDEVIASYYNPAFRAARWIRRKIRKKGNAKPVKTYRSSSAVPSEALYLIKDMTQLNPATRTTVRDAQSSPYIHDLFGGTAVPRKETQFLKCAQK